MMIVRIVRIVFVLCLWVVIQANTLSELEQRIKEKIDATLAEKKRKNSAMERKKAKEQQLSYFSVRSNPSAPKKEVKVSQSVDFDTSAKRIDSVKIPPSKHSEFSIMKNRDKELILSTSDIIDRLFGSSKANYFLSFLQEASNSSEKVKELLKNSFNVQQLLPDEYSSSSNERQTKVFFSTVLSSILFNASFAFVKQEKMRKNKISSTKTTKKNNKLIASSLIIMAIGNEINGLVEQVLTCFNTSSSPDFEIQFIEVLLQSSESATSLTSPTITANHHRHYLPLHESSHPLRSSTKSSNPSLTPQSFLPWLRFTLDSYQSSQVFFLSLQITHYSDFMRILQLLHLTSLSSQHLFPFFHIQLPKQWWMDSQLSEHHPQRREALKTPPSSFNDNFHHQSIPHVRFTAVELITYLEVNGYLIYQIGKRSLLPLNR